MRRWNIKNLAFRNLVQKKFYMSACLLNIRGLLNFRGTNLHLRLKRELCITLFVYSWNMSVIKRKFEMTRYFTKNPITIKIIWLNCEASCYIDGTFHDILFGLYYDDHSFSYMRSQETKMVRLDSSCNYFMIAIVNFFCTRN